MNPKLWMLLGLGLVLALAGCATPDETTDDGVGDGGLGDGGGGGAGDGAGDTAERVTIDGHTYECDDTFSVDGVCDEYELVEADGTGTGTTGGAGDGAQADGGGEFTTEADGSVTIRGQTYVCEDQDNVSVGDPAAGACELYVLQSEA